MCKWLRCKIGYHYFRVLESRNGWVILMCKNPELSTDRVSENKVMGGLIVKGGKLMDFSALRAEVEKLLPGKELTDPKSKIMFRPQPKQNELLRACGVLDWFEGTGRYNLR